MNSPSMAFLFLDECMDEALDLAALTGVLVPLPVYCEVRDAMCRLVWEILAPSPNPVPLPIELHGRELLPGHDDYHRLYAFKTVVDIINSCSLKVIRVCYLNRSEIADLWKGDSKLYGLNFGGIKSNLQDLMVNTLVLPVMDGVPRSSDGKKPPSIDPSLIRAFAADVRMIHHYRQCDAIKNSLTIRNSHNLAEPLFGDSTHSTLLQLVDLVSYLLLQLDRNELRPDQASSPFKKSLIDVAKSLNSDLLSIWRGRMEIHS